MSKNDSYDDRAGEGDLRAFEQQLRSIKPTPPQTAWQDVAQSSGQQPLVSASSEFDSAFVSPSRSSARWHRVVTHAAATVLGVLIGALCMVTQQPAVATAPPTDVAPSQVASDLQQPDTTPNIPATKREPSRRQFQVSWPLTPLSRDIDSQPGRRMPFEVRPAVLEESTTTLQPEVLEKPKSAAELMFEMLNEQANFRAHRGSNVDKTLAL